MIFHPAQSKIASDKHRFRVVDAGRRLGKTLLAVYEMYAKAITKDGTKVAYIAPTYQQARDIAWLELRRACDSVTKDVNESRLEILVHTIDGGTGTISLRGWESIETLRGQAFDFVVIDEIASMRGWDARWNEVVRPTLTDRKGHGLFISTPKGYNHFYELFKKAETDSDYASFRFTTYDNPHIPVEEIDKAKQELSENQFAQEYLADFRKLEGLVYDFPDEQVYRLDDATTAQLLRYPDKVVAGLDWGFNHPTAIVVAKVKDARFYVVDEWKQSGKTTPEIIKKALEFKQKHGVTMWYPDPARPDQIEEFKRGGLNCGEVSKEIPMGIGLVAGLMKSKRFFVASHCNELLDELAQYRYEETPDGKPGKEVPVKENDDMVDAMRYMCVGYRPLEPERILAMQRRPRGNMSFE